MSSPLDHVLAAVLRVGSHGVSAVGSAEHQDPSILQFDGVGLLHLDRIHVDRVLTGPPTAPLVVGIERHADEAGVVVGRAVRPVLDDGENPAALERHQPVVVGVNASLVRRGDELFRPRLALVGRTPHIVMAVGGLGRRRVNVGKQNLAAGEPEEARVTEHVAFERRPGDQRCRFNPMSFPCRST